MEWVLCVILILLWVFFHVIRFLSPSLTLFQYFIHPLSNPFHTVISLYVSVAAPLPLTCPLSLAPPLRPCVGISKWHTCSQVYMWYIPMCQKCVWMSEGSSAAFKGPADYIHPAAIARWWLGERWRVTDLRHSVNTVNTHTDTIPHCGAFLASHSLR